MHLLLDKARTGDSGATHTVVETLRPRLTKMAAYYGRTAGEDPDDLLQEAWIGLLKALPELDITIGSPEQFLIRHAKWQMLDALRRAKSRRTVSLDEDEAAVYVMPSVPETALNGVFVSEFIRKLTDVQQMVLKCLLAGLTWREAGRVMGCTSANIAYYVRQIRRQYEKWNAEQA